MIWFEYTYFAESADDDGLNIKSEDIRKYFQLKGIVPHLHPKYQEFFVHKPAEIALTYQWSSTFREIRSFLNSANIRRHNSTSRDPNPTFWHRLYMMSFLWAFFGTLTLLPENIDDRTIFIDIFMNDQNSIDIKQELERAQLDYKFAPWHIVLATTNVLERAWCLFEIAVRRGNDGRIQLLTAKGAEETVGQLEVVTVGAWGVTKMIWARALIVCSFPARIGAEILNLVWRIDFNTAVSNFPNFFSVLAINKMDEANYYSSMKATVEDDRKMIQDMAIEVFGGVRLFNATIMAATHAAHAASWRWRCSCGWSCC